MDVDIEKELKENQYYELWCIFNLSNEKQKREMSEYIAKLKSEGKKVYYPGTDTNQLDSIGYRICDDNRKAIEGKSTGSFFDLGMSFALKKRLYIVNKSEYVMTKTKSFENITTEWDRISCKPRDT